MPKRSPAASPPAKTPRPRNLIRYFLRTPGAKYDATVKRYLEQRLELRQPAVFHRSYDTQEYHAR